MGDSGEKVDLVVFKILEDDFGVEVQSAREVLKVEEISTIPKAPDFIEGIINVRGHAVAVIDLRKRFGFERPETTDKARILIVRSHGMIVGLIVDSVVGVRSFERSVIQATPRVVSTQVDNRFVSGVTRLKDRMIFLVNLDEILNGKNKEYLRAAFASKGGPQEENPKNPAESELQD